jgi:hypothetical protein
MNRFSRGLFNLSIWLQEKKTYKKWLPMFSSVPASVVLVCVCERREKGGKKKKKKMKALYKY